MEAQTREANITMTTGSILVAVVFAALYVAFLVWYGGKGKPLSRAARPLVSLVFIRATVAVLLFAIAVVLHVLLNGLQFY